MYVVSNLSGYKSWIHNCTVNSTSNASLVHTKYIHVLNMLNDQ